jgi:predicted TPR repeat methyltransferase
LSSSTTASARFGTDDPVAAAEDLIAKGRAGEGAALLQTCIAANRGGLLLRLTLQKALAAADEHNASLATARETAQLYPDAAPAALALGEALRLCGHLPAAIGEFQRALRLDPELLNARAQLGAAWLSAGEPEKALTSWSAIPPEELTPDVRAMSADAETALSRLRSDPRYVRHLFDQFSADYDSRMLKQLAYRAPAILRELAGFLGLGGAKRHAVLDLGCGTGLMGEAIQDWAWRLDGIDLSPQMIEKARAKGTYDELTLADICTWLENAARNYDLILAADTIVYLGDLGPIFSAVGKRLNASGNFLFTAERKEGDGFELGPKRRWRHSESYLRCEAQRAGLLIAGLMPCVPRTEAGAPVEGWAVALAG